MKRTFKIAILFCLVAILTFVFTACNKTDEDHAWSEWIVIKEAKCEEKGLLQRYCNECNYTESKPIDELGHNEVIDAGIAPTCTETGLTDGKHCNTCNYVFVKQEIVPEIGGTHNYEGVLVVPPAAKENGITKYTCSVCNHFYTATDYVPVDFTVTADNRTKIGYAEAENENLVIPAVFEDNGVWYRVIRIDGSAFWRCTMLTSIAIPDSVTSIGEYAFYGCIGLTNIVIPDSVTSIGPAAFFGCIGLTSITIPEGITSIADETFSGCMGLASITIPDSVTSIGFCAFTYCMELTNITVSNGNTVYEVKGNCLIEKASKTAIICCQNSFIPTDGSVTSIGDHAFEGCMELTKITIPANIKNIGYGAFFNCKGLTSITFTGTVKQWNAITLGSGWNYDVPATEVICSDGIVKLN